MQDLRGKVAFVTGAASGIGLGICRAALAEGMRVMMADIEEPALRQAAEQLRKEVSEGDPTERIAWTLCDVASSGAVTAAAEATLEQFGKVHLVCNNAGVSTGGLIDELDDGDWRWAIGVNFLGVLHGCQTFIPIIKRQGEGGYIVNTSSMAGVLGGMAGWGPYNSTKFAVVGLTEVLRQEGREGGFGASVLCPGGVRTNIWDAPRNRDGRYGPQVSKVAVLERDAPNDDALDPDVVGELVLEGVKARRLFIFSDPRFADMVARRSQKIAADFEWAAESEALTRAKAPGSKSA